jgi:hypothetical protein
VVIEVASASVRKTEVAPASVRKTEVAPASVRKTQTSMTSSGVPRPRSGSSVRRQTRAVAEAADSEGEANPPCSKDGRGKMPKR